MHQADLLKAETIPTPKPAKKRPAMNIGSSVAAVCKITPRLNTQHAAIKAIRLPRKSADGAAHNAPKNVPAERMDTINEVCEGLTSGWLSEFVYPVLNSFRQ